MRPWVAAAGRSAAAGGRSYPLPFGPSAAAAFFWLLLAPRPHPLLWRPARNARRGARPRRCHPPCQGRGAWAGGRRGAPPPAARTVRVRVDLHGSGAAQVFLGRPPGRQEGAWG